MHDTDTDLKLKAPVRFELMISLGYFRRDYLFLVLAIEKSMILNILYSYDSRTACKMLKS